MEVSMDRRTFLKAAGFSTVGLALGGLAYRVGGVWWDQTPGAKLRVMSDDEADILAAIADTMFPGEDFPGGMPSATQTGIVEFFDDYLASIDEMTSNLLRVLLHGIDDMAVFADFGATRFRFRPRPEREEILKAWGRSWFSARRGAYVSLTILIAMGYTEHPDVIRSAGYDYACNMPDSERDDPAPELAHGAVQ
jgi:hypothetical protein